MRDDSEMSRLWLLLLLLVACSCSGEGGSRDPGEDLAGGEALAETLVLDATDLVLAADGDAADTPQEELLPDPGAELIFQDSYVALDLEVEAGELPCAPQCTNEDSSERGCGPDGCGGVCGYCDLQHVCVQKTGTCQDSCTPACDGRECGPDGCYGECPPGCPQSFSCSAEGRCYPDCDPQTVCASRECGPDGCGGSCGDCQEGAACDYDSGTCLEDPCSKIPAKGQCLDLKTLVYCADGKKVQEDCSSEGDGHCAYDVEQARYSCLFGCMPDCALGAAGTKECGDDGCGGQCGVCPEGWACSSGLCAPQVGAPCHWIGAEGWCEGNVLWTCSSGKLSSSDCAGKGLACKYSTIKKANLCM